MQGKRREEKGKRSEEGRKEKGKREGKEKKKREEKRRKVLLNLEIRSSFFKKLISSLELEKVLGRGSYSPELGLDLCPEFLREPKGSPLEFLFCSMEELTGEEEGGTSERERSPAEEGLVKEEAGEAGAEEE